MGKCLIKPSVVKENIAKHNMCLIMMRLNGENATAALACFIDIAKFPVDCAEVEP